MNYLTMTNFEKFKQEEMMGEYLISYALSVDLLKKNLSRNEIREFFSNANFKKIALQNNIKIHKSDLSLTEEKKYANALEQRAYTIFKEKGIIGLMRFSNTIVEKYFYDRKIT